VQGANLDSDARWRLKMPSGYAACLIGPEGDGMTNPRAVLHKKFALFGLAIVIALASEGHPRAQQSSPHKKLHRHQRRELAVMQLPCSGRKRRNITWGRLLALRRTATRSAMTAAI